MTKDEFELIMRQLKATYPNFTINETDAQLVWWAKLKDLRIDYARLAVKKYTNTERYAPVPADILNRYREIETHNKSLVRELRDIFNQSRLYYPASLWGENDEKEFMAAIRSDTFGECRKKANIILETVKKIENIDKPYREFIQEIPLKTI